MYRGYFSRGKMFPQKRELRYQIRIVVECYAASLNIFKCIFNKLTIKLLLKQLKLFN